MDNYEPMLICEGSCDGVTRHHPTGKEPVFLGAGEVLDFYRLKFQCNACGHERVYGTQARG